MEGSGSPQPACNRKTAARLNVCKPCLDMTDLLVRVTGWLLLDDSRRHDPRQVEGDSYRAVNHRKNVRFKSRSAQRPSTREHRICAPRSFELQSAALNNHGSAPLEKDWVDER